MLIKLLQRTVCMVLIIIAPCRRLVMSTLARPATQTSMRPPDQCGKCCRLRDRISIALRGRQ